MSFFTNPSFGIDKTGSFSRAGDALTASPFGGGSVLNNWNLGGSTSTPTGTGMDPFSAIATIGSLGASIFGASQARQGTEEAARIAAEATEEAQKQKQRGDLASQIAGFGFDYATQRYNTGAGFAANESNRLGSLAKTAAFEAENPYRINLRSSERFSNLLDSLNQQAASRPGLQSPLNLFG